MAAAAARVEIKVNQLDVEGIADAISYIKVHNQHKLTSKGAYTFTPKLKVGQPTPYTYTY